MQDRKGQQNQIMWALESALGTEAKLNRALEKNEQRENLFSEREKANTFFNNYIKKFSLENKGKNKRAWK